MSLSQEPAFSMLRNHFVCGYKNIMQEGYAGDSGVHAIDGTAVSTTNGAGPHNLQTFVMAPDGTVLHCLPGFWSSADLASELTLAEKLSYIWEDKSITAPHKADLFKRMHLEHLANHSSELIARSHLQGFDAQHIYKNSKTLADCISDKEAISAVEDPHKLPYAAFKTTDKIMHERLASMPFMTYSNFDTAAYTSYGCSHYDKGENEMEGSQPVLAIKGKNLRMLTKPTTLVAAAVQSKPLSTAALSKARSLPSKPASAPEQFLELASKNLWSQAFLCADGLIKTQITQPRGYEMRSLAALKLGRYEIAYNDACRALWLGSNHPGAKILKARALAMMTARSNAQIHQADRSKTPLDLQRTNAVRPTTTL